MGRIEFKKQNVGQTNYSTKGNFSNQIYRIIKLPKVLKAIIYKNPFGFQQQHEYNQPTVTLQMRITCPESSLVRTLEFV
jgi:hypothetical protein